MSKNDGGSAFPSDDLVWNDGYGEVQTIKVGGMTLRDYFAAHAVGDTMMLCHRDTPGDGEPYPEMFARRAYEIADAMLKERKK